MIGIVALMTLQHPNYAMINRSNAIKSQNTVEANYTSYCIKPNAIAFKANAMPVKMSNVPFKQEFKMPIKNNTGYNSFNEVVEHYTPEIKNVIEEFNSRAGKEKQFLNWVSLPSKQLEKDEKGHSHLDQIYTQANKLKRSTGGDKPLVVLGIGGSKHTAEFLVNMVNKNTDKILFYSDIDPISYETFKKQVGGNVKNANYLVVSKSGTTFETKDAFTRFENDLIEEYKKEGMSDEIARQKAQTHFAICTDAKPTDKNLRGKIGSTNGEGNTYLKELYIHDDVGGRYSMFDDPGLFALSYAGVPKEIITRILKGAEETSKKMTDSSNIQNNEAAKGAIFNVFSRENGFNLIEQQYYGKIFEGGGENWAKQLYLESLKDFDFAIGKAPDSMHYATEGQFSPNNREKYNTVMTIMNQDISQNYKRYTDAIASTYNETTPTKLEILDVENGGIKPEAIGEYVQTKHFETVYMGMLRREVQKNGSNKEINQFPEILQPSVETYKNKFKPGSPFELTPGQ